MWRVLDIDRKTGEISLVPVKPTTGTVYLGEAQGYNNAVYLLNEACKNLYGDNEKGVTARSINIEDIEEKMTDEALKDEYESVNNGVKYGEQNGEAITTNKNYPIIYASEKLSVIDGNKNETGLTKSEQTNLIKRKDSKTKDGKLTASMSIQPYQTYWDRNSNDMKNSFRSASNGENYYNLLMINGTKTDYWVASRCISYDNDSSINFQVRVIMNGGVTRSPAYNSKNVISGMNHALFPVVSLKADIINGNIEEGFYI